VHVVVVLWNWIGRASSQFLVFDWSLVMYVQSRFCVEPLSLLLHIFYCNLACVGFHLMLITN
jgi:hypothetical protein